jgi:hypothetical protein
MVSVIRVDEQRQPAPPVVVATARVVQPEHVGAGPEPRRGVPEPGHGPAQQRGHGVGEERAGQLGSAQTVIAHGGSPSDRRRRQPPIFRAIVNRMAESRVMLKIVDM